jgi:hypothetical protein
LRSYSWLLRVLEGLQLQGERAKDPITVLKWSVVV